MYKPLLISQLLKDGIIIIGSTTNAGESNAGEPNIGEDKPRRDKPRRRTNAGVGQT